MSPANEIRPCIQPGRSPRGLDILSVEKQLALPLYFLKEKKGLLSMTANPFGAACCTVSVTVRKVCDLITSALGPGYINLPSAEQDMSELFKAMENKYGFPQAFGCVDGTHIQITQPTENPHDYFSYKQTYTLNVKAVCDWRGFFMNVEVKRPDSVHDGRVFANSKINKLLQEKKLPMLYKEILPGYDKIPVTFLGDPAYPLLQYCMKEYPNAHTNEEVIFNNMLRSVKESHRMCFSEAES